MNLKRAFSIGMFFIIISFMTAQTNINSQNSRKDSLLRKPAKMSKGEYKKAYLNAHQRIPKQIGQLGKPSQGIKKKGQTNTIESTIPLNSVIYPGEFEEVQAVLIAWPYNTVDTTGYPSEQLFKDIGIYYDQSGQGTLGPMYSSIDTLSDSPYPVIYGQLANTIDNAAEVWINVWNPEDSTTVKNYMSTHLMPLKHYKFFVNQGNAFWYRDCGPIAFYYGSNDDIGFMDFQYYEGRPLDDSIPIVIARKFGYPVYTSTVGYEGGNIVLDGLGNLVTSTAVYNINNTKYGQYFMNADSTIDETTKIPLTSEQVNDSLKYLLNLTGLKVVTSLQNDGGTGHMDLYADMLDESRFIFSQYPTAMKYFVDYSIASENIDTLMALVRTNGEKYRKSMIPFPRKDDGKWYSSATDYENYTRSYSNHLFVNQTIIQPVFANAKSGDNTDMLSDLDSIRAKYPGYKIVPIDVRAFDGFGGAIHCITKQIPADNPLRIYHTPINDFVNVNQSYTINANISNKSGIAKSICKWRYKGGSEWNELTLTDAGNSLFTGIIPNDSTNATIEYYITATSKNGKTMTKPMTAPDGYYHFTFSNSLSVKDNQIMENIDVSEFYPNPSNDRSLININTNSTLVSITINDISGNIVYSKNVQFSRGFNTLSINTNILSNGTYYVRLIFTDGSIYNRILTVLK